MDMAIGWTTSGSAAQSVALNPGGRVSRRTASSGEAGAFAGPPGPARRPAAPTIAVDKMIAAAHPDRNRPRPHPHQDIISPGS
jgi:hypothetical protein